MGTAPSPTIACVVKANLDASQKIIWNWRDWPKMLSVRINAFGAMLNIVAASAALAIPAAAPVFVIRGMAAFLIVSALIFVASALGRLLVQPKVAGSSPVPPDAPDAPDDTDQAGA